MRSHPKTHKRPQLASGELHIDVRDANTLLPLVSNARTHSKKQIRQIARSIEAFGFNNPILIDADDRIIAGHGRLQAAQLIGMKQVPTIRIEHLSEAERRAFILADNRLAEKAGWDDEILKIELQFLTEFDLDFDVTLTGFETPEIDLLIGAGDEVNTVDEVDEIAEQDFTAPPVSRSGDLWRLGPHRLLCGDARDPASFANVLDGKPAQMVFTDPPYNFDIEDNVSGLGRTKHQNFFMASGEMSPEEFTSFLTQTLRLAHEHSVDGSLHYVFMDWRHLRELLAASERVYDETKALCVWNKTNAGMGSLYRSQHELILVFKKGKAPHINNVQLGAHGRNRTNVWTYPGVNTFRDGRLEELSLHPTVKPVGLVADAILDASDRNGIVLDPFIGSGTTILAAERTGRIACGQEIDSRYVDGAIRRWEAATGKTARHAETGLTLDALAERRGVDGEQGHTAENRNADAQAS